MRQSHLDHTPVVLIVDDDDDCRELLRDLLRLEIGCSVRAAGDGLDALAILRNSDGPLPCLILLDWMMPRMDGAGVLAELANDPVLATLPVVVCSAAAHVDARGALCVVRKPFDMNMLVSLVREHCDRARTALSPTFAAAVPCAE